MNCSRWIFFAIVSFSSSAAFALFEVRVHYGVSNPKQNVSDLCNGCANPANAPEMTSNYGIGADALIKIPIFNLGFGLGVRYENLGFSKGTDSITAKASTTRTAALLNYRLIDTLFFFGPIASYGLSHSGNFTLTEAGTKVVEFSGGSINSYSIGVEAGVRLVAFNIAVEVGYMDEKWNGAKNQIGSGAAKDINLSGNYGKVHLGFNF